MTYQEIFNKHLKSVRQICNAVGNEPLANTLIKLMFDFSDELKDNDIIGDNDNGKIRIN